MATPNWSLVYSAAQVMAQACAQRSWHDLWCKEGLYSNPSLYSLQSL